MGRNTETTAAVNTGVAQVGGTAILVATESVPAALEVSLVPGGDGAELLTPEGTVRHDKIARIVRYTVMTFRSTATRVRRDGRLELAGDLSVTHVTRELILGAWNIGYSGSSSYSDAASKTETRQVKFVIMTPHAEFLPNYLAQDKEISASTTIEVREFPELAEFILDSDWPIVAQDEECPAPAAGGGRRDYSGTVCTGTAIAVQNPMGPPPSTGRDYSGMPRPVVPREGPVTIVLHLKLVLPPAPPAASRPLPPGPPPK